MTDARRQRLGAALRDNLRRRKAQARGRAADEAPPPEPPPAGPGEGTAPPDSGTPERR